MLEWWPEFHWTCILAKLWFHQDELWTSINPWFLKWMNSAQKMTDFFSCCTAVWYPNWTGFCYVTKAHILNQNTKESQTFRRRHPRIGTPISWCMHTWLYQLMSEDVNKQPHWLVKHSMATSYFSSGRKVATGRFRQYFSICKWMKKCLWGNKKNALDISFGCKSRWMAHRKVPCVFG